MSFLNSFSKKILINFLLIVVVVFSVSNFVSAQTGPGPGPSSGCVKANHNIEGWLFSNGAGWISLNCGNPNSPGPIPGQPVIDFGVSQNSAGVWSGVAWSSYAGWIQFGNDSHFASITRPTGSAGYQKNGNSPIIQTQGVSSVLNGGSMAGAPLIGYAYIVGEKDAMAKGQTFGGLVNTPTLGAGRGWISMSCKNDHNFTQASVQTNSNCGTGANAYGPVFASTPNADGSYNLSGFAYGGLNWGWINFCPPLASCVKVKPDTSTNLVLSSNTTSATYPYKVNLSWTTNNPSDFGTSACSGTAFDEDNGSSVITADRWTNVDTTITTDTDSTKNHILIPPSVSSPTKTKKTVSVPVDKVKYTISCPLLAGGTLESSVIVERFKPQAGTLVTSCVGSKSKIVWSTSGSIDSCDIYENGRMIEGGVTPNDSRVGTPIKNLSTYQVKCYNSPTHDATTFVGETNEEDTEDCKASPINIDAFIRCVIPAKNPPQASISWEATPKADIDICSVIKDNNGFPATVGGLVASSGSKTITETDTYSVQCVDTQSNLISSSGSYIDINNCDSTNCKASTTFAANPACYCAWHQDDTANCPKVGIQTNKKPKTTEDKLR